MLLFELYYENSKRVIVALQIPHSMRIIKSEKGLMLGSSLTAMMIKFEDKSSLETHP